VVMPPKMQGLSVTLTPIRTVAFLRNLIAAFRTLRPGNAPHLNIPHRNNPSILLCRLLFVYRGIEWEEWTRVVCYFSLLHPQWKMSRKSYCNLTRGVWTLKMVRSVRAKNWSNIVVTPIQSNMSQLYAVLRSQGQFVLQPLARRSCDYVSPDHRHLASACWIKDA
jgi:hypothetical protein